MNDTKILAENIATHINRLKQEAAMLNEMIEGYETYTLNKLIVTKLKNQKQRFKVTIDSLDKEFNNYADIKGD